MAQLIVTGIVMSSIIALGAIGITLIYGILKFAHFAHGDLMAFGAYIAFATFISGGSVFGLSFGPGMFIAMIASIGALCVTSVGLDRVIYRPLRARNSSMVIFAIASLGVSITAKALIQFIWGPNPKSYVQGIHPAINLPFVDAYIKPDQIFIAATALILVAIVYVLLFRTKIGKAMRAMADNAQLARVVGIDTERIIMWTWIIGGALMAVAGILLGIQSQLKPEMGFSLILPLFAAAILGGIGNPIGALLGAIIVGMAQEVGTYWIEPGYKPAISFTILIVILLVRPWGILGVKRP